LKRRSGSVTVLLGRLSFNLRIKFKTFRQVSKSLAGFYFVILKEEYILDTEGKGERRFPQLLLLQLSYC